MHDCPTCKVPLHDHEEVCPSCGTRQRARRSYSNMLKEDRKPPVNIMPFVVTAILVLVGFIYAAQNSWVGQLMSGKKPPEDPLAKVTYTEARQVVESKITEGVTATGGTATFKWTRGGVDVDKMSAGPVEVACEVDLKDANQRKEIVDPVKDYFEKAQITTLTMTDQKLHATWTYQVTPPPSSGDSAAPAADPAQSAPQQ